MYTSMNSHNPVMQSNGYTCCGTDDLAVKWYYNKEHGYAISAFSPEEAEKIALQGLARDFRRAHLYNAAIIRKLSKSLRSGRLEMIEMCLKDILTK